MHHKSLQTRKIFTFFIETLWQSAAIRGALCGDLNLDWDVGLEVRI